jgi:hypothetical protein
MILLSTYCLVFFIYLFLVLDIFLTFLTSYYDEYNQLKTRFKEIAYNYLSGWFFVDLASSVPIDYILFEIYGSASISPNRILRLLRMPRTF